MKRIIFTTAVIALAAAGADPSAGQDPKPAPATVTLNATITGMTRLGPKSVDLRLDIQGGKGDLLKSPHVLVDEAKIKIDTVSRKAVAFQGRLSTREVVIGTTNSIPPNKITAKALFLVADKATEVSDDNKANFPPAGMARVQGKLLSGEFKFDKNVTTVHAIENADQPIVLLDSKGMALKKLDRTGTITVVGRPHIGMSGTILLDVVTIEPAPGKND